MQLTIDGEELDLDLGWGVAHGDCEFEVNTFRKAFLVVLPVGGSKVHSPVDLIVFDINRFMLSKFIR